MRFLLCILAVILTYQSVNAQSLWRNSATTNRVPWLVSGYTNIVGTLTNPITTAGAISSTGGFTSAASNYFGTVGVGSTTGHVRIEIPPQNINTNLHFDYVVGTGEHTENFHSLYIGDGGKLTVSTGTPPVDPVAFEQSGEVNGTANTFIGINTGVSNTTGNMNVFVGNDVGTFNTIGDQNTFVGSLAGYENITGFHNTGIGCGAGQSNSNGNNNVSIGTDARLFSTNGSWNVAIGSGAGMRDQGSNNTAIGFSALPLNNGSYQVAVGQGALGYNIDGANNSSVGASSLYYNTNGSFNTAFGFIALQHNNGNANTALGYAAGVSLESTAQYNTFLGGLSDVAAAIKGTAVNSTALGFGSIITENNQVVIGDTNVAKVVTAGGIFATNGLYGSSANIGGYAATSFPLNVETGSGQYTSALGISASTHATSERAGMQLGDWIVMQDINGNGTKDFGIYGQSNRFEITPSGITYLRDGEIHAGNMSATPNNLLLATGSGAYQQALSISASTDGTSERAGILLGNWIVMQDASGSGYKNFGIYGGSTPGNRMLIQEDGSFLLYGSANIAGSVVASTTITATNGFFLPTQTAPPVVAGGGTLWNSNSVLYWVTATKTNMVSDGR